VFKDAWDNKNAYKVSLNVLKINVLYHFYTVYLVFRIEVFESHKTNPSSSRKRLELLSNPKEHINFYIYD